MQALRAIAAASLFLPTAALWGEQAPDYSSEIRELSSFVRAEAERQGISSVGIALVDGERTVWEAGFGFRDSARRVPATEKTVYRVGSISKLFTAILVLQLVEKGVLDLDAPISKYAPELVFEDSAGSKPPITLRQLLCHRAGIARESPVGSYFDDSEPGIEATVKSFLDARLVYPPGERTKYSNVGPTIAGYVIERVTGTPFTRRAREALLDLLGMASSSFLPDRESVKENLAEAFMVDFEGRFFPAPTFSLGTLPAGNLYASASDLARFLKAIFAGGELEGRRILDRATLESMFVVQPPGNPARSGFGLGFYMDRFEGRLTFGHDGAVYGFASALVGLPEEKLGVVVLANVDCASGFNDKIVERALRLLLRRKLGIEIAPPPEPIAIERSQLEAYCGLFFAPGRFARAYLGDRGLQAELFGFEHDLVPVGTDRFVSDGRLSYGRAVRFLREAAGRVAGLETGGVEYARVVEAPRDEAPSAWERFCGEYGWPHNVLLVRPRFGKLSVRIEWFFEYPLEPESELVFRFPDYGLYHGERLVFVEGEGGRIVAAKVGPVAFPRR